MNISIQNYEALQDEVARLQKENERLRNELKLKAFEQWLLDDGNNCQDANCNVQ